jgi:hypothetical protein
VIYCRPNNSKKRERKCLLGCRARVLVECFAEFKVDHHVGPRDRDRDRDRDGDHDRNGDHDHDHDRTMTIAVDGFEMLGASY